MITPGKPSRYPELKARIDAAKARPLAERIDDIKTAIAGLPEHWSQYQWVADQKHAFGDKRIRTICGDDGYGQGRQWIATVPGDNSFGTLADYVAAANPDTVQMLLDRIAELEGRA
jgi:hypothetical protein